MDNQRNLLLAVVLSGLLILGWDVGMRYFYPAPPEPVVAEADSDAPASSSAASPSVASANGAAAGISNAANEAEPETGPVDLETALAALDAQLPGKLINNPYDIQWSTVGSDKKEAIVESEGAPGGVAYSVRVKKTKNI